jgi:glycosyltransferase involved in cell wall biosynthesis
MTTYNRAAGLRRVLDPIVNDPAAHEVIVVIDGCHDGSLQLVEELARDHRQVRPVFIENSGDMAAREAGASAANGEVVLFLDDDVLAGPGLVAGHADRHRGGDMDAVVGYMPVPLPSRRRSADVATRLYAREYEGRCEVYEHDPESVLRELWGGNFSMRRVACLEIGMANPRFTEAYHADRDFGIRCLAAGMRGGFDRSLRATHLHERTLASFRRDARSQGAARVLTARQHSGSFPVSKEEFERGLPAFGRHLVRFGRRPRAHTGLSATLELGVRNSGTLRLWIVQDVCARLLRRLEQQLGAIEQSQGRRR